MEVGIASLSFPPGLRWTFPTASLGHPGLSGSLLSFLSQPSSKFTFLRCPLPLLFVLGREAAVWGLLEPPPCWQLREPRTLARQGGL